ncbi:sensor histidine kinase [Chitinibacter tainanensis]|uniref:sensor histidine kinase n=1 Tax=Chitinibacter tainanensis TaxID=230667 RepID=UPI00041A8DFD|nr:histidine kinase [Chitinibacter tainanensis]
MAIFSTRYELPEQPWWQEVLILLVINSCIGGFLTIIEAGREFSSNMLIAHSIGASIGLFNYLLCRAFPRVQWNWRTPIAMLLGVYSGFHVASWFGEPNYLDYMLADPSGQWRSLAITLAISVVACAFFVIWYHSMAFKTEMEKAQRREAEARQAETASQLAMLQAQIEPHFLFNTLANVHSLISRDPGRAQIMLEHLNNYLRASLSRTRQRHSTLADELNLLEALLAISAIRLGERLRYRLEIEPATRAARLPPLLLQPLVENALEHGIEPAIEGGEIIVRATHTGQQLCLQVLDSGLGWSAQSEASSGIGLANVRARLEALYGADGQLAIYPHPAGRGVLAEIRLPFELEPSATTTPIQETHS